MYGLYPLQETLGAMRDDPEAVSGSIACMSSSFLRLEPIPIRR